MRKRRYYKALKKFIDLFSPLSPTHTHAHTRTHCFFISFYFSLLLSSKMEKHSNAKSKYNRSSIGESNTVGARSGEHSQKRLEEPPKFYSKKYLKRYTRVEVRGGSQKQSPLPLNQGHGKRSPTTDQRTPARSAASQQQKYVYLLFYLKVVN